MYKQQLTPSVRALMIGLKSGAVTILPEVLDMRVTPTDTLFSFLEKQNLVHRLELKHGRIYMAKEVPTNEA